MESTTQPTTIAQPGRSPPKRVPETLVKQLAPGGVMVLPLGPHARPQNLVKLTKSADGLHQEELLAVRFVPLLPGQAREL